MRTALVSLFAASSLATVALAQTAMPPAPPATSSPPAVAAPVTPPDQMTVPTPQVAAPVPEKVYAVPTTGEVGQIINVINTVCVPLVRSGNLDQLASSSLGYKKNRRDGTYTTALVAKPYTLTIYAPGSNKSVCRIAINYTTDQEKAIIVGLNIYSLLHQPELLQQRNDYVPATDFKRITNSWEYFTDKESTGLVFLQLKKPDGTAVNPKWDMGEVLYSERTF